MATRPEQISILIIEAQAGMRSQLRNMLSITGMSKIQFAVSAGVAVRKLRESRFDIILCEYHLGDGQDGQHLLEDLRHHAIIPMSTLFIMVTGERQYERVVGAAELAPNDYILKPFAADALYERLARALTKRDAFLATYQLMEIGDIPSAIASCRRGAEQYPQWRIDFMRLQAELHVATGQADEAQQLYKQILELRAVPWARLGLAKTLFMLKKYSEAEVHLESLVAESEMFIDAYDWLARTREAAGKLDQAREVLDSAASVSPNRINRIRRLGHLAMQLGDVEAARTHFSEVVRKGKYSDFRDPEDHVSLISAQLELGATDEAQASMRDLERSMAGLPKTRLCTALSSAMVDTRAGNHDKARETLDVLLADRPELAGFSNGIKHQLAKTCFAHGMDQQGSDVVLDIMRTSSDPRTLEATRQMLADSGRAELAERLETRVREEVRDLVAAGAAKAQHGDYDGAVEEMLNAVRKMPGNPHVLFNAALALLRHIENRGFREEYAERARKLIDQVRTHDPANAKLPALLDYMHGLYRKYGVRSGQA
ncbi:MAG: tetratricopeptide repeat protein [Rhodocyclaceae bacterium]|nr:tetratricopeptide repeat protein [Rhodocyclaceae bacterium]